MGRVRVSKRRKQNGHVPTAEHRQLVVVVLSVVVLFPRGETTYMRVAVERGTASVPWSCAPCRAPVPCARDAIL